MSTSIIKGRKVSCRLYVLAKDSSLDSLRLSPLSGKSAVDVLILQARPIGEPVVQQGPFVMNTRAEIMKAFEDYRATQFGGWPWPQDDMVHGPGLERFAKYPDGRTEKPKTSGAKRPLTEAK